VYIHNLFPTPVACFKFREYNEKEKSFFNTLSQRQNAGNVISVSKYVLENESLSLIKKFIEECLLKYKETILETEDDIEIYITQSWVNWTTNSGYHHIHAHPNSIISGVLYLVAENGDKINFTSDRYNQIQFTQKVFNQWNSNTWDILVKSGDLLLFPSSLPHCVPKLKRDGVRASLSFNTFVRGEIGRKDHAAGLKI